MTDLEEKILSRLAQQLGRYHPCYFLGQSLHFYDLPDVTLCVIDDTDDLQWFAISFLAPDGMIHLERFALDEFDKLRRHLDDLHSDLRKSPR